MKNLYFIITIIAIAAYFSIMYYGTTITIEWLEDTYHVGTEIKFAAKVRGFGDGVPGYSIDLQKEGNPGIGIDGVGVTSGVDTTYLNFPLPFEKTINYSHTTNIYDDRLGSYIMKFSTLGHTVEKKVMLLP